LSFRRSKASPSRDLKLQHIPMLTAFRQVPDHRQRSAAGILDKRLFNESR
jgi:hypothetical protein